MLNKPPFLNTTFFSGFPCLAICKFWNCTYLLDVKNLPAPIPNCIQIFTQLIKYIHNNINISLIIIIFKYSEFENNDTSNSYRKQLLATLSRDEWRVRARDASFSFVHPECRMGGYTSTYYVHTIHVRVYKYTFANVTWKIVRTWCLRSCG